MPALRGVLRVPPRCLVLGHRDEVSRERHRLFLRCARCGRETPGWAIGPPRHGESVGEPLRSRRAPAAPAAPAATMGAYVVVLRDWTQARIVDARRDAHWTVARAVAMWSHVRRGGGIRLRLAKTRRTGSGRR